MRKLIFLNKSTSALLFIFALGFVSPPRAMAQLDMGITVSPGMSTFLTTNNLSYRYTLSSGFGVSAGWTIKKIRISTGFQYLMQGASIHASVFQAGLPDFKMGEVMLFHKVRSLTVPFLVDWHIIDNERLVLFAGVGLYSGYIHSQTLAPVTSMQDEFKSGSGETIPGTRFDPYLIQLNAGIGFKIKFSDTFNMTLRPNMLSQLSGEQETPNTKGTTRMRTYALDIGLSWILPNS